LLRVPRLNVNKAIGIKQLCYTREKWGGVFVSKLLGSPYLSLILLLGILIPIYSTNAFGEYTVYPLAGLAIIMVLNSGFAVNKTMKERKKERKNIS